MMASSYPPVHRPRGGRWAFAVAALLFVAMLRLLPQDAMRALDAMPPTPSTATTHNQPGATFPGSAYFLAEDAFAPLDAPRPMETGSAHVLPIEQGPAALSMPMRGATSMDAARALLCMTNALYYEAGNEPEEGQRAVAQVILNRVASGRWPPTVCGVVYQGGERADRGCQFTFSCDGSMARAPYPEAWTRARRVAARALSGEVFAPAGLATFYHTLAVRPPWAERVRPVAVIGAHIFYRLPGEAGAPAGYRMRYAGREWTLPGPYAFIAPPRPLDAPAGPDAMDALEATAIPAPALPQTAPAAPRALPYRLSPGLPPSSPERSLESSGLPQSTIRAEYRNSGRPLS